MHRNSSIHPKRVVLAVLVLLSLAFIPSSSEAVTRYQQTNLVSDVPGLAANTDPNLVNPWGIAYSPSLPFWVANNGTGVATLYNGAGTPQALVVTIPPAASKPTGLVFNGGSNFELSPNQPARFLFATEGGTIAGWQGGTTAATQVITTGAVYTGLAIGNNGSGDFLYAANFSAGNINVFNSTFAPTSLAGGFTDPNLPSGYAPFNIQNLGGSLFVTYAVKIGNDNISGVGNGIVDVFDLKGNLSRRLISNGVLNSPWGLAPAPSSFGTFAGDLLVGNHGDGLINAFDPTTGASLGTLADKNGTPIFIDGLRGLIFGNGGNGGDANTLYFTAGPDDGAHGLFGSLAPVPLPGTLLLLGSGLLGILAASRKRYQ
jgi:uncharacterized protein (TIGR03118 family)